MKDLTIYQTITTWLSGKDIETASECSSSEINRMGHEALMVLVAPLIGLFSYTYAIYYMFGNLPIAIAFGALLSIIILLIDRSIVGYSRSKFSVGMIGRFLLAIGLAFTMAEPILLHVFQPSIQEQLAESIKEAQQEAAAPYTRLINNLEQEIEEGENRLHDLQQVYTQEMDGTGGSGIRNKGPIYEQKYQDYEDYKTTFSEKEERLRAEIAETDSARFNAMQQVKSSKADGLIAGLRALHDLGEKESVVFYGSWLLRLVLVFIELCPLLIKMTPTGGIDLYNQLVDQFDRESKKVNEMMSSHRQKVALEKQSFELLNSYFEMYAEKVKRISKAKSQTAQYRMNQIAEMAKARNTHKQKIANIIDEQRLLDTLHGQIDDIFEEFLRTINNLGDDSSDLSLGSPKAELLNQTS